MLRKIRIVLAAVMMVGLTWLFVDFTGTAHHYVGLMAKVQALEAVLAVNVMVIAMLTVLTLLLGRIYCSVVCPLGIMQDIFGWLGKRSKKNRYSYSKAVSWLRYMVLMVFIVACALGIGVVMQLLAPYSAYGRIATNLLQPVWIAGNNLLATIAEKNDSYTFYHADVWMRSWASLAVAGVTLAVLAVLAWRGGRTYCNSVCPVGTLLSVLSRFSLLKVRFDAEKCRNCSLCSKNCKASCIDYKTHRVDASRCVVCGNCIEECKFGALKYSWRGDKVKVDNAKEEKAKEGRRSFLLSSAMIATAALAQEKKKVDGGLAKIVDKVAPKRHTSITPPGSISADNMSRRCTGCQLCISECPNQVLRPSNELMTLMQPVMSYERGYCRVECNRCSKVCPAGAIEPISHEEKASTQIGHAVWIRKNCLPLTDGVTCDNCVRHCPVGAIELVKMPQSASQDGESKDIMVPAINETRCIGCGACENLCPARPFSAIYVEGHEVHGRI